METFIHGGGSARDGRASTRQLMSALEGVVPSLRDNVDLTRFTLSVEEAFVASRVDGRTTVEQIATLVGKEPAEAGRIVRKLASLGVLELGEDAGETTGGGSTRVDVSSGGARLQDGADEGYGNFIFSPALMHEAGDLDEATRKRVIFLHAHLAESNHYELLQLPRKADQREVRAAYFERSKEWHPDRYKRMKDLGSFRRMIEEIYRRINEAYKILSDGQRRKEYDGTLPVEPDPEAIAAVLKEQIQAERDVRRAQEGRARRQKNNPVLQRFARGKEFYEQALNLEQAGKISEALRVAQMAATYDDRQEDYKRLFDRLRELAGEERIVPILKRGKHFESLTQWEEAIQMFTEAVRVSPSNGEARHHLAYSLLAGKRPIEEAMSHAQRAVAVLPDSPEAHYVLAWAYEIGGNEKLARKHYERAVELRPGYQDAKKKLKRLKWGF